MEKAKIDGLQLFILIFLFEMGSAIVLPLSVQTRQDAWISVLGGMLGGLVLFLIYQRLYLYYPNKLMTTYIQDILGTVLGRIIGFVYVVYFLYLAARVLRDFGELLVTFSYPETPVLIINAIMMATLVYALNKGIEVMARTSELSFVVLYILAIIGFVLVFVSGLVKIDHLRPMLENGIKPILKAVATETLYVPFGEMIVFTMILPYLNRPEKAKAVGLSAVTISGINLMIITAINIGVLGVDLFSRAVFPLLATIQQIEMPDFLERLDIFFLIALVIGGFFKIGLFFYAATIGAAEIFRISDYKKLVYIVAIIILFASISIADNYFEHIKEGLNLVPIYLHLPFQIVLPLILLIIAFFKNRKKTKERTRDKSESERIK
ncbi:GerAB/ArcD/ProY family transporter [Bacillus sp. FSL W8-0116]|uniref:GerAB/ArcD/ProY family transporter n=1 Tax=Bacillus sp. FSL W8-0116 TaxID=2978206 RepID=UPI0030F69BF8